MEYIKLKDLCEKEERFVAPNDDAHIDYVDISSVDNKSKSLTKYDTYIFAEAPSRARKRVKHGDVIVSTVRPNLNAVARFDIQTPHTPIASTGFCVLRPKSDVDPIYIYFFCISPNFVRQMVAKATGASYPAVSDTIVREAKLPKHTAEKRVRIVSTLSKAKEIIEHRRTQLAKLDELVKCRFVEMFGDLSAYEAHPLNDVCTFIDYRGKTPIKAEKGIPLITAKNVGLGVYSNEPREYIDETIYESWMTRGIPRVGDILFTTEAPLGHVCRIPEMGGNFSVGQRLIVIQPTPNRMDYEFVSFVLQSRDFQDKVLQKSTGSTVKGIRSKELIKLSIPVPPLNQQHNFATFVSRIDKLRFVIQQSLDETQKLFDSLMQEYFE